MKQKVLIDVIVRCDPPYAVGRWSRTLEDKARRLEEWCQDFEEFIRDHRSQDPVSLNVERQYQEQCSLCGREWEEDDNGPLCCKAAQEELAATMHNVHGTSDDASKDQSREFEHPV